MRRLTFTGFLDSYVRSLGGGSTLAVAKLAEASAQEPRLVEPMLLWAVKHDQGARLARLLGDRPDYREELALLGRLQATGSLENALMNEDPRLRPEYVKVWRSYVARRDAQERDKALRLEARKRVLALESTKHVTRYRMAKDLGLNPGNLHAFLTQGNPTKLSLDRVADLVSYLETR